MRLLAWERYVVKVEDNRARHARGEPAIVFSLRPPTGRVWRQFWQAVTTSPKHGVLPGHLDSLARAQAENGGNLGAIQDGLRVMLATLDDDLSEILWLGCVGAVEWPKACWPDETTEPPTTGAEVWTLRDSLDSFALYADVLDAVVDRAHLEAGLHRFLASAPGPAASDETARPGTAVNAGAAG